MPRSGYERLARIGEQAVVAAGTGDAELLGLLIDDWTRTAAALPATPEADAGPALARAAAAHAQLGVALAAARDRVGDELAATTAGRRVAAGYGAGTAGSVAAGGWAEHRA